MSTLVVGEQPEIAEWLERRRALGLDRRDEVWDGVYHVAPLEQPHNSIVAAEILRALGARAEQAGLVALTPFNLGSGKTNFRCPDGGWLRKGSPLSLYLPTAAAVLEVLSPDDETYDKLPHYLNCGVTEILVVHPTERWIKIYLNTRSAWEESAASALFRISMKDLAAEITWP